MMIKLLVQFSKDFLMQMFINFVKAKELNEEILKFLVMD